MTDADIKEWKPLSTVILQQQTLKTYLKSVLKETWSMNAGNFLYSWHFEEQTRATKVLGIPLEKLPTTNNHLEGMNEQEQYSHLSEMTFSTYQEALNIHRNLYAEKSEMLKSSENNDEISNENNNDNENIGNAENTDNESNNDNSSLPISSNEVFNYMGHILGIDTSTEMLPSKTFVSTSIQFESNVIDVNKFREFLESTLRGLQTLQEIQYSSKSEQTLIQKYFNSNSNVLLTHLHDIVISDLFKAARILVDIINEEINPYRHVTSSVNIIPLEQEKIQCQKQSYNS
ncbi:23520_t:CDS:2 [Gigaspora margarita]|uniref:23520_t:CDS:1 n=1 Tax=Gigaspora margarita TaxID=4874 RepID=A0ABN7VPF8_GIGMA|nr:23520_t:CDS:2 [Gigaspora margarita]